MVRGTIRNLDTTRREFDLTLLKVHYDTAISITGTLADDECVIASGPGLVTGTPPNVFVYAPSIIEVVPCVPEAEVGDRILMEGRSTPIRGTNSLSAVALNEVTTTPTTEWYSDNGFVTGPDFLFNSRPQTTGESRRVRAVCAAPCSSFQAQRVHLVERNTGW